MKKSLFFLISVLGAFSLNAQTFGIQKSPIKAAPPHASMGQATNYKPFSGIEYRQRDSLGVWSDSMNVVYSYYADGALKSEVESNCITGEKVLKTDWYRDARGLYDHYINSTWNGTSFVFASEDGVHKTYDSQNRLLSVVYYSISESIDSTGGALYFDVEYGEDSTVVLGRIPGFAAPDFVLYKYVFYKIGATQEYNAQDYYLWNGTSYQLQSYRNIVWNKGFDLVRILGYNENDRCPYLSTDFTVSLDGTEYAIGRVEGDISPAVEVQTTLYFYGTSYIPNYKYSYFYANDRLTFIKAESGYDTISGSFTLTNFEKFNYTLGPDDRVLEYVYSQDFDTPDYEKFLQRIVYDDFYDLNGVAEFNDNSPIVVSPNPAHTIFNFALTSAQADISITNMLGVKVNVPTSISGNQVTVDISGIPSGFYILTTNSNNKTSRTVVEVLH